MASVANPHSTGLQLVPSPSPASSAGIGSPQWPIANADQCAVACGPIAGQTLLLDARSYQLLEVAVSDKRNGVPVVLLSWLGSNQQYLRDILPHGQKVVHHLGIVSHFKYLKPMIRHNPNMPSGKSTESSNSINHTSEGGWSILLFDFPDDWAGFWGTDLIQEMTFVSRLWRYESFWQASAPTTDAKVISKGIWFKYDIHSALLNYRAWEPITDKNMERVNMAYVRQTFHHETCCLARGDTRFRAYSANQSFLAESLKSREDYWISHVTFLLWWLEVFIIPRIVHRT